MNPEWVTCSTEWASNKQCLAVHTQGIEQKLNYVGRRTAEAARSLDNLWLVVGLTYLTVALLAASYCGRCAAEQKRNSNIWFVFGLLLPMIAVPALYLLTPNAELENAEAPDDSEGSTQAER